MPEKIIHIDNIGNVTFRKNKRSKNVSITLRPTKGVVVNMPYFLSYRFAINIVEKKRAWILGHLPKIEDIEKKATIFTENTFFKTKYRKLLINKNVCNNIKTIITPDSIIINYPENIDVKSPKVQEVIRTAIIKTLRSEAKDYLPDRTMQIAKQHNFKYNKVFIKNNKTLWGSCSAKNNINLNLHLLRLPDHLVDYIIIHELCHTVEKNHGKQFWELMDTIQADAKKLSKELRNYSLQIY
ncbi:MAG: M48 family metallopeptidase [Bacteroidales bacterium]|nr:M48 family metallopeptidase [Bacteroidales bacterium]